MLRLLPILGFVVLVLVANWPYKYEDVLNQPTGDGAQLLSVVGHTGALSFSIDATSSQHAAPTLAGWPCKFYLSVADEGESRVNSFSWIALFLDLCFWALVPIAFLVYERFLIKRVQRSDELVIEGEKEELANVAEVRQKKRKPSSKYDRKLKRRSVQLADIFVVTAFIAAVFGYWRLLQKRSELDRKFAVEISNSGGGAMRTAMLPWIARDLLRVGGHSVCLRISEVKLTNPDDQLLTKVVALPYLRTLNIVGGTYDFTILNRLATNPLFSELAIVGRPLNGDAIAAMRAIQSLRKLNLMRTNITAAGVAAIEQPRLRELNLVHTEVQLADLGTPAFSKTIRKLILPHPAKGNGDRLTLDGWPELTELACYEFDELLNSETVALTLKNLPKLYKVELDGLQKFDLDFEQLPAFAKLEPAFLQWDQRTTPKEVVPSFVWTGKLRIKNVPNLNDLTIFAADAESISIDQGPLQIALDLENKGGFRAPPPTNTISSIVSRGHLTNADVPLARRQKWIDDLAKCEGLEKVNLDSVSLEGVTLKPLTANKSIRELVLNHSGLVTSQLNDLQGCEQLQELSLIGTNVDGRTIEHLAKSFPNLRKVRCERDFIARLRLENVPNLESLFEMPENFNRNPYSAYFYQNRKELDALRIVNAPLLRDHFIVDGPIKLLYIENAPSLSGLSFQSPLPDSTVLKGLANLKFFAAGGPTCTDAIVAEVLGCKGLQRLTLAFSTLSPETWQKLADLRDLEYLVLTGSNINDKFTEAFGGLEKLKTLRLGRTEITKAAIPAIAKLKNLEVFDFEGVQLNTEDVSQLVTNLPRLKQLSLAGAELTADNMRQLSKLYSIQSLDLSGCKLSDELVNAFLESPPSQLIDLKLNSATFSDTGFAKLVRTLRTTRFAVKDTKLSLNLLDPLVAQGRALEHDYDDGPDASLRIMRNINYNVNGQKMDAPHESDIDPKRFAPKEKDPLAE